MSRQITQPVTQVRFTNVAVVRMNKHGKRFELACYRNKVVNYRQGIETDLDEVLQTDRVFTNVSKGEFAKSSDLKKAFNTTNEEEVCRVILMKGQLQVSDMERSAHLENTLREVASMVCEKCVNPQSNRPYTVETIRDAMKEAEFNVSLTRNVKQQFLDCVKLIQSKKVLPLERAKMRLCATVPSSQLQSVQSSLKERGVQIVRIHSAGRDTEQIEFLMDPSLYRDVDKIVKGCQNESIMSVNRLEILEQAVFEHGDIELQSEVDRIDKRAAELQQKQQSYNVELLDTETVDVHGVNGVLEKLDTLQIRERVSEKESASDVDEEEHNIRIEADGSTEQQRKSKGKKSKKARRREKEEETERQKQLEYEKGRQKERGLRMLGEAEDHLCTSTLSGSKTLIVSNEEDPTKVKSCNTCGGSFTVAEYRAHFKSDWHRFNLKLKLQGVATKSQKEYELCDADSLIN